eukprot:scaffold2529_cov363-Prasinococcus_capsulatus_cf.AAC.8
MGNSVLNTVRNHEEAYRKGPTPCSSRCFDSLGSLRSISLSICTPHAKSREGTGRKLTFHPSTASSPPHGTCAAWETQSGSGRGPATCGAGRPPSWGGRRCASPWRRAGSAARRRHRSAPSTSASCRPGNSSLPGPSAALRPTLSTATCLAGGVPWQYCTTGSKTE